MSITPPDSALGRSLEAWASGHYPRRADVRELLDDGYDVGAMEARHFIPRTRIVNSPCHSKTDATHLHTHRNA